MVILTILIFPSKIRSIGKYLLYIFRCPCIGCIYVMSVIICTGFEVGLPFCSVDLAALLQMGSVTQLLQWKSLGLSLSRLCSLFSVCFPSSPHWGFCPKGGKSLSKSSECAYTGLTHRQCGQLTLRSIPIRLRSMLRSSQI